MKFVCAFGKLLSGIIATISGIITLLFNEISYKIFDKMSVMVRYIYISVLFMLGIFLICISIIDLINTLQNNSRKHRLKYQSKKFKKFFSTWYNKPGFLNIICDDLDWIRTSNSDEIYQALLEKSKGNNLSLFLATGLDSEIVKTLQKAGAKVFSAPKSLVDNYTFSCISVMGNSANSIIVRNKQEDNRGSVMFYEICNTYVTGLLNTLLEWRK